MSARISRLPRHTSQTMGHRQPQARSRTKTHWRRDKGFDVSRTLLCAKCRSQTGNHKPESITEHREVQGTRIRTWISYRRRAAQVGTNPTARREHRASLSLFLPHRSAVERYCKAHMGIRSKNGRKHQNSFHAKKDRGSRISRSESAGG